MPRNFAKKTTPKPRTKTTTKQTEFTPSMLIITGVIVGLLVAGLIYLGSHTISSFNEQRAKIEEQKQAKKARKQHVAKIKEKKHHFDFYKLLKEATVELPRKENSTTVSKQPLEKRQKLYILQVASFKNASDADTLKAELLMQGFDVQVKTIDHQGAKWTRVSLGPYERLAMAEKDQDQLRKNSVDSLLKQVQ